jgi:hypothetical protein
MAREAFSVISIEQLEASQDAAPALLVTVRRKP